MQIKQVAVEKLIPYVRNSRTHSDAQVAQIAASIKEFGWTNPILVDGTNGIIAGHGRLLAARKLGQTEVPVIELAHMTESQKKAYVIADNQLAMNAGWDTSMLTLELSDLKEAGFSLDILGFDPKELDNLLEPEQIDGLTDEDAVPDIPDEPKTKLGDIYQLGNHRLMCGDSTSIDAVEKLMNGVYPDLIHTDPPYGMNAVSKSSVLKKNYKIDILGDDTPDVAKDSFRLIYGMYPEAKQIWWGQIITAPHCQIANAGWYGIRTMVRVTRQIASLHGQILEVLLGNLPKHLKRQTEFTQHKSRLN